MFNLPKILGSLEGRKLTSRLAVSWAICIAPRIAFISIAGYSPSYRYFQDGFHFGHWYPLYELFSSILWMASQENLIIYIVFHVAVHATIGPFVYLMAKQMNFSTLQTWFAVAGVACMPYYVSVAARQPQVGVTITFFAIMLSVFLYWTQGGFSIRLGILFALVSFLLLLLRPNAFSTVFVLYAFAFSYSLMRKSRKPTICALLSGIFLTILVWGLSWENMRNANRFSLTSNSGYNLYIGNNTYVPEYLRRYDILSLEDIVRDHGLPEEAFVNGVRDDAGLTAIALEYMKSNQYRTILNMAGKTLRYWDFRLEDANNNSVVKNVLYTVPYLFYAPLALPGAYSMWKRKHHMSVAVVSLTLLSYYLPHAVYFGTIRMRMTTEFLLIMLASYAFALLIRKVPGNVAYVWATRENGRGKADDEKGESPSSTFHAPLWNLPCLPLR
jgi:hypothetical protein